MYVLVGKNYIGIKKNECLKDITNNVKFESMFHLDALTWYNLATRYY